VQRHQLGALVRERQGQGDAARFAGPERQRRCVGQPGQARLGQHASSIARGVAARVQCQRHALDAGPGRWQRFVSQQRGDLGAKRGRHVGSRTVELNVSSPWRLLSRRQRDQLAQGLALARKHDVAARRELQIGAA
jgi:hypothetical protein